MTLKTSKIKVLHIIKSLGRGGAEMLLPETLELHDKDKFEFHYIYFLPWKNQMVEFIEKAGGKVVCFSANNNLLLMAKLFKVIKYIKEHDFQLIHAHLPWAGVLSRFVHKLIKIPVIYTEHNKQERYHKITFLLNKLTFAWQNCVIAVSKDVKKSILQNIDSKTTIRTILNGVNTVKFKRNNELAINIKNEYGIPENALVVGTMAVFRFQKRLVEWLQVFKVASDQNPNLFGIIVGDGPLKEELILERARLGLEERVLMPGLQTNTQAWFSTMDIFMMSSVFEGLPIALLEAMSMECAIITTDAGGVKEVIRYEHDGLIVPVGEWPQLANQLEKVAVNKEYRIILGQAARKRVEEDFSMTRMVKELETVYQLYRNKSGI